MELLKLYSPRSKKMVGPLVHRLLYVPRQARHVVAQISLYSQGVGEFQ